MLLVAIYIIDVSIKISFIVKDVMARVASFIVKNSIVKVFRRNYCLFFNKNKIYEYTVFIAKVSFA